jgi:hypothetical protein
LPSRPVSSHNGKEGVDSRANAEAYLRDHANVVGKRITVPDAVAVGSAIFGQALEA